MHVQSFMIHTSHMNISYIHVYTIYIHILCMFANTVVQMLGCLGRFHPKLGSIA